MHARLADAATALQEGRRSEGLAALLQVLMEAPDQDEQAYLLLTRALYQERRFEDGVAWVREGLRRLPASADLWNLLGVLLRNLGRTGEALDALDTALRLKPMLKSARVNRANVLLDLGEAGLAVAMFTELVAAEPADVNSLQGLAGALLRNAQPEEAGRVLRQLIVLRPEAIDGWTALSAVLLQLGRTGEAETAIEDGLARNPGTVPLLRAKAALLSETRSPAEAERFLGGLRARFPNEGWLLFDLGKLLWNSDPARGEELLRKALSSDPRNLEYMLALAQALDRLGSMDDGVRFDEAYHLCRAAVQLGAAAPEHTKIIANAFGRVGAFDDIDRIGTFSARGRGWAQAGLHAALLMQLARVSSREDRLELLAQHRIWGDAAVNRAAARPLASRPGRESAKLRVGFLSSDLRNHPVSYFAGALFEHVDRERFEVYAYSFSRKPACETQAWITDRVDAFRWWPDIDARQAAEMIAEDRLDILIELGGSTSMNKLELLAYKPAPLQASWLGYPHSTGLTTIDYFICDRLNRPADPDLLLERPLELPGCWVTMSSLFDRSPALAPVGAEQRKGYVTFGTASHPQKFTRASLTCWAQIVAATPGARFAVVRPEGASAVFRRNVEAVFAEQGVAGDRLVFYPVGGRHMPFYNEIDITLDTFPLTGGTTTVEALWMGCPVITLVGEAFHERMSYSLLSAVGLPEFCARDLETYQQAAVSLAQDSARLRNLRASLRDRIAASPLGQSAAFAGAFYESVAKVCRRG